MTDLEITKLCAEAMDYKPSSLSYGGDFYIDQITVQTHYDPLRNDAQAMALVKKFKLGIDAAFYAVPPENPNEWYVFADPRLEHEFCSINPDLNRAICECVAKMHKAKLDAAMQGGDKSALPGKETTPKEHPMDEQKLTREQIEKAADELRWYAKHLDHFNTDSIENWRKEFYKEIDILRDLALSALTPARDEGLEGELWSFLRRVMEQGSSIQQDYAAGKYESYEHYAARIDEAARERVEQFRSLISRPLAQREEGETFGWLIENAHSATPQYWNGLGWTDDHQDAIRYARSRDACGSVLSMPNGLHLIGKVVEHGWRSTAPASPARDEALEEAARAGAVAYAGLLRGVQNNIPVDVGTDRQAYDHIILRLQDKFGSYEAQIALAVERALRALRSAPEREGHIHTIACRAKGCSISSWLEDLRDAPASPAEVAGMPEEPPALQVWRNDPQTFSRTYQDVLAYIDNLRAYALRAAAPGAGWQPIETAPKDGTKVWVYAPSSNGLPDLQCECSYHPDAGFCVDELRVATHWHPLRAAAPGVVMVKRETLQRISEALNRWLFGSSPRRIPAEPSDADLLLSEIRDLQSAAPLQSSMLTDRSPR